MSRHLSSVTTRTLRTKGGRARAGSRLLGLGELITSPETGQRYVIERLLGEGGFGQVYLARTQGRAAGMAPVLCIKVSTRSDGWLREAYFGQVLDGHPRAIRIFDRFPLLQPGARSSTAWRSSTPATAIFGTTCSARRRAGPRSACAARSRASSRCCGSSTAGRCCIATSRR